MAKFLKDLSVGDRVVIATFNLDNPMNIIGCEHDVQATEGDNIIFKNLKPDSATITLKKFADDNNPENYQCILNKWHYTGKPKGQYAGIFNNKETLLTELQNVVKSNIDAKKRNDDKKKS